MDSTIAGLILHIIASKRTDSAGNRAMAGYDRQQAWLWLCPLHNVAATFDTLS